MSDENSSPAAGWYPDPENSAGERWWNGVGWSDHRRPKTVVATVSDEDADDDYEDATPPGYVRPDPYAGSVAPTRPGSPYAPAGAPNASAQPYGQPTQPYGQPAQPYGQPAQPYSQPAQPYGQPTQPYGQPTPYGPPGEQYGGGAPYGAPGPAPYGAYQPVPRSVQNIPALIGMIVALAGILLNIWFGGLLGLAGGILGIVGLMKSRELAKQGILAGNGRGFALTGIIAGFLGAGLTWLFYIGSIVSSLNSPY